MVRTGVMQEIKDRLLAGETAKDLIDAGFSAGSTYKCQWQLRQDGLLPVRPKRVAAHEKPGPHQGHDISPDLQGDLSIFRIEGLDFPFVYWHPIPPVPCPACGVPVGHWQWCPLCKGYFAGYCDCPEDSPEAAECYGFEELLGAVSK
jgi:hypothetical protein